MPRKTKVEPEPEPEGNQEEETQEIQERDLVLKKSVIS